MKIKYSKQCIFQVMLLIWEDITGDQIIDYSVGSVLIICFLVSPVLNPTLLYHYYLSSRKGVTTFLFSLQMSESPGPEFLANLVAPLVFTAFMITSDLHDPHENILGEISGCFSFTMGNIAQSSMFNNPPSDNQALKDKISVQEARKTDQKMYLDSSSIHCCSDYCWHKTGNTIKNRACWAAGPESDWETAVTILVIEVRMT